MRMIGHLATEADARLISDLLYVKGIKNQIEEDKDGTWILWVHGEDELGQAKELLGQFRARALNPDVTELARQAEELREQEKAREEAAAKRHFDGRALLRRNEIFGMGRLTAILIFASVSIWILTGPMERVGIERLLEMGDRTIDPGTAAQRMKWGFQEIKEGQVWRLLTPIFLHAGILHILLNMMWLHFLGSMVEAREGSGRLAWLVLMTGVVSNVAQYLQTGPAFCGMSGVGYALLGYVWMKSKYDLGSGYFVHESVVVMMLIWLLLGFTGKLNTANMAHLVGLLGGVAFALLALRRL